MRSSRWGRTRTDHHVEGTTDRVSSLPLGSLEPFNFHSIWDITVTRVPSQPRWDKERYLEDRKC